MIFFEENKKKILTVDDDDGTRHMIRRILLMERKYILAEAVNGYDAEEKLKTFKADLIILDAMMPEKDGCQTCRDIRNDLRMKDVKIIGISGNSGDMGKIFVEEFGADCFLEKPFSARNFKAVVSEMLKEKIG